MSAPRARQRELRSLFLMVTRAGAGRQSLRRQSSEPCVQ